MIQIDMDMPKTCEECPLCHRAFDGNETRLACYGLGAYCFEDDGRLDNCPLHEVTADHDTVSRKQALEHIKKRMYESALNNDGIVSETFEEIADNRIQIWIDELPPSPIPSRPQDISKAKFSCPICGAEMEVTVDEWDEGGAV